MAAITTAALSLGMAGYQAIEGDKQRKAARRALNDYERQELDNAFKDISISTYGSDLLREENARTSAGLVDAAQQGGSRSIIGAIPKIVAATNEINQEAAKNLDGQVINRDYAIAGDNARIEGITENRDNANIAALSSQEQAGKQDFWNGLMGAGSAISYGAKNIDFGATSKDGFKGSWNERQAQRIARGSGYGTPGTPVSSVSYSGGQTSQPYFPSAPASFSGTPYSAPQISSTGMFDDPYAYGDMVNKYSRF